MVNTFNIEFTLQSIVKTKHTRSRERRRRRKRQWPRCPIASRLTSIFTF